MGKDYDRGGAGDYFDQICINGKSATQPFVLTKFNPATFNPAAPELNPDGPRPHIKVPRSNSFFYDLGSVPDAGNFVAVLGMDAHCFQRDPDDPGFIDAGSTNSGITGGNPFATSWRLYEDNRIRNFFQAGGWSDVNDVATTTYFYFRRNIVEKSFTDPTINTAYRCQGIGGAICTPTGSVAIIEENHTDSNGWTDNYQK